MKNENEDKKDEEKVNHKEEMEIESPLSKLVSKE